MKNNIVLILVLTLTSSFLFAEKNYTQQEYINSWKNKAIEQMSIYKIPASITLAQGILESAYGNSLLAQQANNHFGIKCHDWAGESFHKDDDQKNECFRKYPSAEQSFEDHSQFLQKSRYSGLFAHDITNYKAWANGLKDAGYATNPKYPDLLINLIEKLNLDEFDKLNQIVATNNSKVKLDKAVSYLASNKHNIEMHKNGITCIIAKKGDTYYRISKEFGLKMSQLYKFNEFGEKKDYLEEGDIIYLEPKKKKSSVSEKYVVSQDEKTTIRMIAQNEGIRLQRLLLKNNIISGDELLEAGREIKLK
jgi:hypothetical protein